MLYTIEKEFSRNRDTDSVYMNFKLTDANFKVAVEGECFNIFSSGTFHLSETDEMIEACEKIDIDTYNLVQLLEGDKVTVTGKSLECANEKMIAELEEREDLAIELNDLKLSLYNQWHDLNATFGIDNLVGIQEFIENNSRIKELRSMIKESK